MGTRAAIASRRPRAEQIMLFSVGGLLCASGCVHVLVWLADGGSLSGPISWRKPILFGFSAGVTVLSMGWVVGKMKRRPMDFPLLASFGVAMLVEVGLITLQQWRGVASHFNRATPFDATVLTWIEWLILFVTLVIAEITRRSFLSLSTTSDMTLAIRSGMALLLLSCILGFVLSAYGTHRVSEGFSPELYPPAGVMKFPHGVPMHVIQFLPILAWTLRTLNVAERQRYRSIAYALSSSLSFTLFSLLQTFTGRTRFDVWWLSGLALMISGILISVPVCIGLSTAVRRLWRGGIRV
jgi:hypothetical protein